MTTPERQIELVAKAQKGCRSSADSLANMAQGRLRAYIFRLTLDEHLTQDLVQDACLEIFRFLHRLENPEAFWGWCRRIATNVVRDHYRKEKRNKTVPAECEDFEMDDKHDALASVIATEWKDAVLSAMKELRPAYRQVLVLRCYEQLSYAEIAEQTENSEMAARMLFVRAKRSLAKRLGKKGLGRGSLAVALTLFGKLTAPSEAAAAELTVAPATLRAGTMASLAVTVCNKAVVLSCAAGITAAAAVVGGGHFMQNENGKYSESASITGAFAEAENCRDHQLWYYYPAGQSDFFMMRKVCKPGSSGVGYTKWLQNADGNYYYDPAGNTVVRTNCNYFNADGSIRHLPGDSQFVADAFSGTSKHSVPSLNRRREEGTLIITYGGDSAKQPDVLRHPNVTKEEYFRGNWPAGAFHIDARDDMHRNGWCYFSVSGDWNGKEVVGRGGMPFTQRLYAQHKPWFLLNAGGLEFTEMYNTSSAIKNGSMFCQVGQPWRGLHCIDVIRKWAQNDQRKFDSHVLAEQGIARVDVYGGNYFIRFHVSLWDDLLQKIELFAADDEQLKLGELSFSYFAAEGDQKGFEKPELGSGETFDMPAEPWPFWLASGALN